jgi:hypothetical protein
LINVGSVGQPRDGDPRACYVILDDGQSAGEDGANGSVHSPRITYRRVAYDFEKTIQKIYGISELEPFLGDRLRQGR